MEYGIEVDELIYNRCEFSRRRLNAGYKQVPSKKQ